MNLRYFWGKINENYGWDVCLFHKLRDLKDGITFFEFTLNLDKYMADHNPKFGVGLIILNFTIFEFNIYNVWHIEHSQSPFFEQYLEERKNQTVD